MEYPVPPTMYSITIGIYVFYKYKSIIIFTTEQDVLFFMTTRCSVQGNIYLSLRIIASV